MQGNLVWHEVMDRAPSSSVVEFEEEETSTLVVAAIDDVESIQTNNWHFESTNFSVKIYSKLSNVVANFYNGCNRFLP